MNHQPRIRDAVTWQPPSERSHGMRLARHLIGRLVWALGTVIDVASNMAGGFFKQSRSDDEPLMQERTEVAGLDRSVQIDVSGSPRSGERVAVFYDGAFWHGV